MKAVAVVDPVAGGVLLAARTSAAGRKDRSPAGQRPRVGARGLAHLFGVAGLAAHVVVVVVVVVIAVVVIILVVMTVVAVDGRRWSVTGEDG